MLVSQPGGVAQEVQLAQDYAAAIMLDKGLAVWGRQLKAAPLTVARAAVRERGTGVGKWRHPENSRPTVWL